MPMRLSSLGIVLALASAALPLAASNPVPMTPLATNLDKNPYLQVGIDAIASGLRTVTISIDIDPESGLARRVNRVHFGMNLTGWTFAAQELVTHEGTSSILLLTYRRQPAAT